FVSWSVVTAPPAGFKQYNVYRSVDGSSYSLLSTSTRLVNYIIDDSLSSTTEYYYKVNVEDDDENISFFSPIVSDIPQGEGGTDLSSPLISSIATSSPGTNFITITWATNELSNSTVGYSTTPGNFDTEIGVASMVISHSVTLTDLTPDSTYYFQVKSTDPSSNTRTNNNGGNGYVFTTGQGPVISNVTTPEITNNTAKISWITNTSADTYVVYSINSNLSGSTESGSVALTTSHLIELTSLSGGTKYYFYVKSTDGSSNLATDKNVIDGVIQYYTFTTTQDTTGPTMSSISASNATSSSMITWTTNELADSTVNYGTTGSYGSSATSSTLTIDHVLGLSNLTNNTTYHYQVISTDANGNTSTSSDQTFLTNTVADATAPVISNAATSSVDLTVATITWTTDEAANSLIDYGITVSLGSLSGQLDDSTTTHSVSLSNLSANTTYYYQVRSQDSAGNTGTDDNSGSYYSFITTRDTTAPTISNVSSSTVSNNSATIIWTTNELSTSQINYGTTNSYGSQTTLDSTLTYQHSVKLTNLTKQTTYHFQVVSEDSADNSTASSDYTILTTDDPGIVETISSGGVIFMESSSSNKDTTAPVISNIRVTNINYSSVTINWNTNEDTDTFVEYGTTKNYEQGYLGSYDNTTKHSLNLTSLSPGTTYYFRALGKDSSGNLSRSGQQSFATLAMEVGTSEEVPAEEKGTVKSILDNLSKVAIESLQLNSNSSLASISNALEETAQRINKPPLIAGDNPLIEVGSDWARITWVTDKKSNSIVAYVEDENYDLNKDDAYADINGDPDEQVTAHTVTLNNLKTETTYHFQVRSKSPLGDWAKSSDKTFTTLSLLPQISRARLVAISETSVTLQWNTNLPTQTKIDVIDASTGAKTIKEDNNYLKEHQLTIDNLDISTDYSLQIFSTDEQSNESSSEILSFSTTLSLEPSIISQVRINTALIPGKVERVQAIISWKTNKPATSRVLYEEGAGRGDVLGGSTSLDSALEFDHIVITTAFKPGKVYRFRVESVDAFGNVSISRDYTILTPKPKESVLDLIINNFEQTFGFLNRLKF
ncbi:MAG: fibronectin type III domain-containing protein, partial [bacterium]